MAPTCSSRSSTARMAGTALSASKFHPGKARDTQATIEEVRRLWKRVQRKNLMVKIPATREGLPAIEQMLSEGININITLLFAVDRYRAVATRLPRRTRAARLTQGSRSIMWLRWQAFLSAGSTRWWMASCRRRLMQESRAPGACADCSAEWPSPIRKVTYEAFKEIFSGPRWDALKAKGAGLQRPLWGSTGTKNPAYSDLLYVDATHWAAHREHGPSEDMGGNARSWRSASHDRGRP